MELNQNEGNVPDNSTNGTEEKVCTSTETSSEQSTSLEPTNTDLKNKLSEKSAKPNGDCEEKPVVSSQSSLSKCGKCSFEAPDQASLDNHVCQSPSIPPEIGTQKEVKITCDNDTFVCGECGFSAQGPGFEEHLMCHLLLKPYQCIYCKESFINRKEIGRHVAVAHKGKKMNCALRAMKKAKAYMVETRKTGSYTFMAKVSGRVPLTSTKSDSAKMSDSTSSSVPSSTSSSDSVSKANTDDRFPTLPNKSDDSMNSRESLETPEATDHSVIDDEGEIEKNGESQKSAENVVSDDTKLNPNKESIESVDGLKIAEADKSNTTDVTEKISDAEAEGSSVVNQKIADGAANEDSASVNGKMSDAESTNDLTCTNKANEKITETEATKELPAPSEENAISESEATKDLPSANEGNDISEREASKDLPAPSEGNDISESEATKDFPAPSEENAISKSEATKDLPSANEENDISESEATKALTTANEENDISESEASKDLLAANETNETIQDCLATTLDNGSVESNVMSTNMSLEETNASNPVSETADISGSNTDSSPIQDDTLAVLEDHNTDKKQTEIGGENEADKLLEQNQPTKKINQNAAKEISVPESRMVNDEPGSKDVDAEPALTNVSSNQDDGEETPQPMEQDSCEKDVEDPQNTINDSADLNLKIVASFSLNDCPTTNAPLNLTDPIENSHEDNSNQISETPRPPPPLLSVQEVMSMIQRQMKNDNFYACGFQCDFSCLNSSEFREHLQIEHFGSTTYPCCHCGWTTHNEESLLKHVTGHAHAYNKTAPLYFCGVLRCRFGTNIIPEFINHMNILHPELLQFNCKECGAVFENTSELVQHFEDNYLHVVNCPHCCSKAQNRHVILRHISEAHPGKPKMLSVGKQIICKDRKVNSFYQLRGLISNMRRSRSSITNLEHILNLEVPTLFKASESDKSNSGSPSQSIDESQTNETDGDGEDDDNAEDVVVKSEAFDNLPSSASSADTSDRIKQSENLKCDYCTFVAKDNTRLSRHQTCHSGSGDGRQQAKKQRFKCPYCPQCFENLTKFSLHVSCHPGLIKYTLLTCKQCEFNSNQKHNMLRHIETRCGRNFVGCSEDMYREEESVIESKVLECDKCGYQTRHKIHLKNHYEAEHNISYNPAKQQASSKNEEVTELNTEEMSVLRTPPAASSRENLQKKFMCPVCFYLLPKGADLKKHIRKHPELGKVSLVLFRCRYCSCASTAKHVIAGHIKDKHPGRDVALVKKIISVDTREQDNSFSETQVSETPVSIPESEVTVMLEGAGRIPTPSISKIIEDALEVNETYYHVFIVPEYEKGNFHSPVNCPCCEFLSYAASPFIQHLKTEHPKVCIIGKQGKGVQKYYKLGNSVPFGLLTLLHSAVGLKQEVVVLSHKDVFGISAQCPKCVFSTYFKQNLALHIRDHHREVSILESQKDDFSSPEKLATNSLPPLPPMASKAEETLAKLQILRKQDPIIVGSGILDDKLKGLYENLGFVSRCAICGTERPKRYHMHVHVLRHLNVSLWKCQYCDYKGLERYKMCKHIKDQHPQKKMAIKYLPVDIEETITEYLNERSAAAAAGVESSGPKATPGAKYSMDAAFSPLGNDDLDEHLKELYREDGEIFYCILCSFTVRRKFAIHRHLVSSHLAIALVGCGYCGFRGIDRKSIIDHSHEQHNQSTLNVILLPNDLKKTVADCLSSSGLKGEESTPIAEPTVQFQEELPKAKQKARKSCPTPKPATIRLSQLPPLPDLENSSTEPSETKKYVMGTEALDIKLKVLFTVQGGIFICNICETNFPRRYAIHRHLLMSHLKLGLMQCPLCPFTGVERYLVMNHLKDYHKLVDQIPVPNEVDMDAKISEFLSQELSQNRNHFIPRKKPNYNKNSDSASSGSSRPMVVAMFNKRKSSVTKEDEDSESEDPQSKKIKQEVMDEEIDSSYANSPNSQDDESSEVKPEAHWEASNDNVSVRQARSMIDVGTAINVLNLCQGSVKKFGCERCSFTSVHRSNVQRHVFRVHEKYRYKICKLCGYRTLSNVLIRQHIQDKHTDATDGDIEYEKLVSDKASEDNSTELSGKQIIQQGLYACAYCDFETNTSGHIVKHMEHEHPKTAIEEASNSTSPVLKIPSFPPAKSESAKKKTLSCNFCSFECSIFRLLKSHVALVHKDQPKAEESLMPRPSWKYACVECHLKMDAGTKMKCHIGRHFNYKPYVCETCSADFASPDEMRKHIRRYLHSEKINYVKDEDQEERLEALLEESKRYALDIQEGKCPNLNPHRVGQRIAKTKTQIMTRVITPAELPVPKGTQKRKLPPPPVKTEDPGKQMRITGGFGCSKCDFTSQSINDVSTHHMRAHRNKTFLWRDLVMEYLCDVNGKVVEYQGPPPKKKAASFKTTNTSKGTVHTCSKCGFNTGHLQGIVGHVKAHGIRDYLCAYCSNRYFKRAMLNRHQKSLHKGKRLWIIHQTSDDVEACHSAVSADDLNAEAEPFSDDKSTINTNTNYCCHQCDYRADSLYQYRLHIPTHGDCEHLVPDLAAESPLKCDYCAYIAVDQRDFSAHITIHLSDRTYKCFFCEYSSYQRKDVQSHLLSKHSGEGTSDENKCIVSSKDLSQGKTKTNESGLPMLANLDPRVVLNRIDLDDIPHGYKRLSLSSVVDVSSAFQILESEMGALTDSELNEDQERLAGSENASEISLSLDSSSLADSETISISDAYVTNISQDVLDQVSITNSPADSGVPSSSKSDAPSEFDNFDSIDKAIEQLSNQSDKTDSTKTRTRTRDSRSSKNLFDSFKS